MTLLGALFVVLLVSAEQVVEPDNTQGADSSSPQPDDASELIGQLEGEIAKLREEVSHIKAEQSDIRGTVEEHAGAAQNLVKKIQAMDEKVSGQQETLRGDIEELKTELLQKQDERFAEILRQFKGREPGFSNYGSTAYNLTANALSNSYRASRKLINGGVGYLKEATANIDVGEITENTVEFTTRHASYAADISQKAWVVGYDFVSRKYVEGSTRLSAEVSNFQTVFWKTQFANNSQKQVCSAISSVGLITCDYSTASTQRFIVECILGVVAFLVSWIMLWLGAWLCGYLCCPKQTRKLEKVSRTKKDF